MARFRNLKSCGPAYLPASVKTGLQGYWKMDEASWNGTASEVVDASGNAKHGVRLGTAQTNSAGKISRCGYFPNADLSSGVNLGSNFPFTKTTPFSIAAWLQLPAANNQSPILGKWGAYGWLLKVPSSRNALAFQLLGPAVGIHTYVTPIGSFPFGSSFLHAVATYSGSGTAAGVHLYQNGVDKSLTVDNNNDPGDITNAANANIGQMNTGSNGCNNTYIDELGVWNRVLTTSEIAFLYNNGNGRPFSTW